MASSIAKSNDWLKDLRGDLSSDSAQSIVITERYFCLVFTKYGIPIPEDASWKEMKKPASANGHWRTLQEVPNMLFEIADLFEDARVEELVKKCERLRLNSGNLYGQFIGTITTLLDDGLTWGKVIVFFSFSVSYTIYLCTNEMSHLAARVGRWAAQVLQDRLVPWIVENGGWVCMISIHCFIVCVQPQHTMCVISFHRDGMPNLLHALRYVF